MRSIHKVLAAAALAAAFSVPAVQAAEESLGENQFVNEIIWKRQSAHSDAKQGSKHLGRVHDSIFLYSKSDDYTFNHLYRPYDEDYIEKFYKHVESNSGRRYSLGDITAPRWRSAIEGQSVL